LPTELHKMLRCAEDEIQYNVQ